VVGRQWPEASRSATARPSSSGGRGEDAWPAVVDGGHLNELVDVVKNYGLSILPADFCRPPHLKEPPWRQALTLVKVEVMAEWRAHRSSTPGRAIRVGEVLPANGGLYFRASMNGGAPIHAGHEVRWQSRSWRGCYALLNDAQRPDKTGCAVWTAFGGYRPQFRENKSERIVEHACTGFAHNLHLTI
jgi:hypothetical protein